MEKYDYLEAVKEDVKSYIEENYELSADTDWEELSETLNDDLWTEDSVTGNASGSYYCNAWKAEEALCHNTDLLGEALREFGCDASYIEKGAEACDVTIRCYLLGQAICEVINELKRQY